MALRDENKVSEFEFGGPGKKFLLKKTTSLFHDKVNQTLKQRTTTKKPESKLQRLDSSLNYGNSSMTLHHQSSSGSGLL